MRALCFLLLLSCSGGAVSAGEPLIPVLQGNPGRIAFLDSEGAVALETDYSVAEFFQDGMARVCHKKCGYIDSTGQQRFGFDLEWIGHRSEGKIPFCEAQGCGFLGLNGEVLIPARFEQVQSFSEGLAGARQKGLWGFIDSTGKWKVSPRYGSVDPFSESRASVQDPSPPHLFGLINKSGEVILKFKHQRIYSFSGGRARFFHWDRYGFLNSSGIMELPASLEWAQDPVSGLAYFIHENSQGYRVASQIMLSISCPGGSDFASQDPVVARVRDCESGLFHYIDGKGNTWKKGFIEASEFRSGFALARKDSQDHFLLINASGEEMPLDNGIRPAW